MKLTKRSSLVTVALAVGDALRRRGIRAVLTGGACASLFSSGVYQSVDVDFILEGGVTGADLDEAMASLGFTRRGDHYAHPAVPYVVEFPRGPLAIGADHRIRPVRRRSRGAETLTLSATDSCRDRLAAFFHWNDRQSLAAAVAIGVRNRVHISKIRQWSIDEGAGGRFEEFLSGLKRARAGRRLADLGGTEKRLARARRRRSGRVA